MSEHTKTPWMVFGSIPEEGVDCFWIKAQPHPAMRGFTKEIGCVNGYQSDPEQEANARHIVHCVNNHERLVELLAQCSTELAESIEGKYQGILGYPSTDRDYRTDMAIVEEARTLLAALEAEKGGEL